MSIKGHWSRVSDQKKWSKNYEKIHWAERKGRVWKCDCHMSNFGDVCICGNHKPTGGINEKETRRT